MTSLDLAAEPDTQPLEGATCAIAQGSPQLASSRMVGGPDCWHSPGLLLRRRSPTSARRPNLATQDCTPCF